MGEIFVILQFVYSQTSLSRSADLEWVVIYSYECNYISLYNTFFMYRPLFPPLFLFFFFFLIFLLLTEENSRGRYSIRFPRLDTAWFCSRFFLEYLIYYDLV